MDGGVRKERLDRTLSYFINMLYFFSIIHRKRKLYSSTTSSEKEEVMKIKDQMEQQIKVLAKQISIEERALFAETSKPLQLTKSVWYYDNIFLKNVSSRYFVLVKIAPK